MIASTRFVPSTTLAALLCAGVFACVGDRAPGLSQSTTEDGFGGFDAGVDFDALGPNDVAIGVFAPNFGTITHGVNQAGELVAGSVTLSWLTHAAADLELTADGEALSLDGCVPDGDAPCAIAGHLTLTPTASRTYTLRAVGADGGCGGAPCPERSVRVDVVPPARAELAVDRETASAGVDLPVPYTLAHTATFSIGRVVAAGDDDLALDPCVPEPAATAETTCVLEPSGDSPWTERGVAVFLDVQRDFTIGIVAHNGAGDGLGDVALGEVSADITVPVEIRRFEVVPPRALPGTSVQLVWVAAGTDAVTIDAPDTILGLDGCALVAADGTGYCTVQIDPSAPYQPIALTMTARRDEERLATASAVVDVISGPVVDRFLATPAAAVPGQPVLLSWTAYGADAIHLSSDSTDLTGIDACTQLMPSGDGSCTVQVAPGADLTPISARVTASHATAGPADSADLTLDIEPAPEVTEVWVDDDTVGLGDPLSLHWVTANAVSVTVVEVAGAMSSADLLGCSAVDDVGEGSCQVTIPAALPPGPLTLSVVANGPTGARSAAATVTVTVNGPPVATFSATPELLPREGGEVTLAWTAIGADRVYITDASGSGVRVVDTEAPTACDSGVNCVPLGDAHTLHVTTSTLWTLRAVNAYGAVSVAARVRLEGAPAIEALTLDDVNLLSGNIVTQQPGTGTLGWALAGVDDGDLVTFERAPLPGRRSTCAAVAPEAWTLAAGFPRAALASGSATIGDLDQIAECFRFTVQDTDEALGQRDVTVFQLRKDPAVQSLVASAQAVAPGATVELAWTTSFAYEVSLTASPAGAVTAEDLAACDAVAGSCALTIQPETPLGDVTLTLTAIGDGDVESQGEAVTVTVGVAPTIVGFVATPASAAGPVTPTLSWQTTAGKRLTITEGDTVLLQTTDPAIVAMGAQSAGVTASARTWRLVVDNPFGAASATTNTFIGPSIDTLTVNGADALHGDASVVTGAMTVAWTTTNANGEQALDVAPAPANGGCQAASFTTVFTTGDAPASASFSLGTVIDDRCVRLRVSNDATPPQTSLAVFRLRDRPELPSLSRSPSSLGGGGGVVTLTMGVRGATALEVTATYLAESGAVLGTRDVCHQGSLSAGQLTGGAAVDVAQCEHAVTPCNILCLNSGMPSATARIRYRVVASDQEGDDISATTSDVAVD